MQRKIDKEIDKKRLAFHKNFIELIFIGSLTGILAGVVATLFNILVHEGERISQDVYAYVRKNPSFIPLLVMGLLAGAFLISVLVNVSSVIRGCGIPQAEGATRGIVRLQWWKDLAAMFAASLVSIFMGLSIGAEGPSALIGAAAGDGVASLTKRNEMIRKYQITGGACTGLAVASNAPLTGIAFAFEEAHKRFTPEVFICAFSSVIFGMLTRTGIYSLLNLDNQSAFHSYVFNDLPVYYYGHVILVGILCGLLGVLFHKACFYMRKQFKKIQTKDVRIAHGIRVTVAVLLGGTVSLLAAGVMGGGHELIESMGTKGGLTAMITESVLGVPIVWMLLIVLILRFCITSVNVGAGIPCGIFIPIIAIGACLGGVLNRVLLYVDAEFVPYCDLLIMICMASFFATVIRAPITAIVMICEFTGSFAPLLPVIIAVCIGYCIGEMSRTDGIYEELLEEYEKETGIHEQAVSQIYTLALESGAIADKRLVRDILWPIGARVTEIHRGEERILPDGQTRLCSGDILTIICRTDNPEKTRDDLTHILG